MIAIQQSSNYGVFVMEQILSDPYGFIVVCALGGWTAVICAFAFAEVMTKLLPPTPYHKKRGATRRLNND